MVSHNLTGINKDWSMELIIMKMRFEVVLFKVKGSEFHSGKTSWEANRKNEDL